MSQKSSSDPWLVRPENIKLLWKLLYGVLGLTVAAQIFIYVKSYFGVDGWFGFGAAFGFISCVIMVVVARVLGYLLKRDENYYQEERADD